LRQLAPKYKKTFVLPASSQCAQGILKLKNITLYMQSDPGKNPASLVSLSYEKIFDPRVAGFRFLLFLTRDERGYHSRPPQA
jgi:hypothetical protein